MKNISNTLLALSDEERLIIGLDVLSPKNLKTFPPEDSDQMGNDLHIGPGKCDRYLRPWINRDFRKPKNLKPLPSRTIKTSTTYKQLKALADV